MQFDNFTSSSGSVVDRVMKMMENYTANLERIVGERTAALEDTQRKADNLLLQVL